MGERMNYENLQDVRFNNQFDESNNFDYYSEFPEEQDIFVDRYVPDWDNPLQLHRILIIARPGAGKDHTWRYILKQAAKKYGDDLEVFIENQDMYSYYDNISYHPIQAHVFPDMTNVLSTYTNKQIAELSQLHVRRRHLQADKMQEAGTGKFGLQINIQVIHRLHGIPPIWHDYDWLIVKSEPDNPFDVTQITNKIGVFGLSQLSIIEKLRDQDPKYLGYGVIKTKSKLGISYNPMVLEDIW